MKRMYVSTDCRWHARKEMRTAAGLTKGEGDTLWVLHRGSKPWDAATFFSGGRAEHITDATPIRGPIMMQLKQV